MDSFLLYFTNGLVCNGLKNVLNWSFTTVLYVNFIYKVKINWQLWIDHNFAWCKVQGVRKKGPLYSSINDEHCSEFHFFTFPWEGSREVLTIVRCIIKLNLPLAKKLQHVGKNKTEQNQLTSGLLLSTNTVLTTLRLTKEFETHCLYICS